MHYLLLCVFSLSATVSLAQSIIQGRVISHENRNAVSYANIGVANKNLGTLSNEDGTFLLRLPDSSINDTLLISALGYSRQHIPVRSFQNQTEMIIELAEKPVQLGAVTISLKKEKNKTFDLGNNKLNGGVLETDSAFAGRSIALLIDNREPNKHADLFFPVYLKSARLRIFKNNLPTLRFRIRINAVDPTSFEPGEDLLRQSIVVESGTRKGWLEFDLSKIDLVVTEPFFVTFEQILDMDDRSLIAAGFNEFMIEHPDKIRVDTIDFEGKKVVREFAGAVAMDLPGTFIAISTKSSSDFTCYERDTSFGAWKRVHGIVTATVTLSNQRPSLTSTTKTK